MTSVRRVRVRKYLSDWHNGFFAMGATKREDIAERIASNVVPYFGMDSARLGDYTQTVQGMIDSGVIRVKEFDSGELYVEM